MMESQPLDPAAVSTEEPSRSLGALIALAGAGLVIAGSALPWVKGAFTIVGTEGDGRISLALGIVLAILALRNRLNPEAGIAGVLVVAALLGLLTAYEIIDIRSTADQVAISIGYGLWIMAVGVALAIFGVIRMRVG